MINAIGQPASGSSVINTFLRELGSARRGKGPLPTDSITRAQEPLGLGGKSELTEEEITKVDELEKRDREVRQHEAGHKAAAGQHARGGPQFEYTRGPDGKQYVTGGEVSIDTSKIPDDPQATIRKMQQVRRAATAPADPSSQDRSVAAQASQIEAQARMELVEKKREERTVKGDASTTPASPRTSGVPTDSFAALFSQPRSSGTLIDIRV